MLLLLHHVTFQQNKVLHVSELLAPLDSMHIRS